MRINAALSREQKVVVAQMSRRRGKRLQHKDKGVRELERSLAEVVRKYDTRRETLVGQRNRELRRLGLEDTAIGEMLKIKVEELGRVQGVVSGAL